MTAEEIAAKLASHEQKIVGAEHRIKDLEETQKQIWDLTVSVKELAISVKGMVAEQKEQGKRLDLLEGKPGKKWEKASDTVITTIIGGLVGAAIAAVLTMTALGM